MEEALGLIVETSRARLAYLELYADSEPTPRFWRGHGLSTSTLEEIRSRLSTGVISSAIAEGETISTPSARMDSRFKDLESVRQNEIDAVLCAPVGDQLPVGVLYLQGRSEPGAFSNSDQDQVEALCLQVAHVAGRLLGLSLEEETKRFVHGRAREVLVKHDGNLTAAARELGIGRAWLRTILRRK
ncbi:MAG: GAF domain-containing protein [Myxococcales bacterium]|nr:GAF domain-containing protein [Myxococcales bacterium]